MLSTSPPEIQLLGASPALFVENQGQWSDSTVRFVHQGDGAAVAMTDTGPVFRVSHGEVTQKATQTQPTEPSSSPSGPAESATQTVQFSANFVGANPVTPVGEQRSETLFNYFVGDHSSWRSQVPGYEVVTYPALYEGIDLRTFGQRSHLKYEFHVAPQADYRQIRVHYEGIDGLSVDAQGNLHVQTSLGELTDDAPLIYQQVGGQQVPVAGKYELVDADTYTFAITGPYDRNAALVIDPKLSWATYLGGSDVERSARMAVDATGNVWVAGQTASSDFSGAGGTYRSGYGGYVAKVGSTGSLVWASYMAGYCSDIAVDASGNVFVTGVSSGAFVTKLSSSGSQIWTHTLSNMWDSWAIALDSAGDAVVAGGTTGTHQGDQQVCVQALTSGGYPEWAASFGGSKDDRGLGVAIDSSNNILVTGYTDSTDFPGANNSLHGGYDMFVAHVAWGGFLGWSTYLGGSGDDGNPGTLDDYDIAVDSAGNAYVTGQTRSTDFSGASNSYYGGLADAFVAKVSGTGTLAWARYLGGDGFDVGSGITLDQAGHVLVTGTDGSDVFSGGDGTYHGSMDAFVAVLSSAGRLDGATFLGGTGSDGGCDIAADSAGNVFVSGLTQSTDFQGATNSFYGGLNDAFVVKLNNQPPPLIVSTLLDESDQDYGPGDLSLREALWLAAQRPGDNVIGFAEALRGGTIILDASLGQLVVDNNVDIQGLGADQLTIQGSGQNRIFGLLPGVTATISGLALTGGAAPGQFGDASWGGALFNPAGATLTLDGLLVTDSSATWGGGIGNLGTLTLRHTIVSDNSAYYGGGITNYGNASLVEVTVLRNRATSDGGGIAAVEAGILSAVQCTVSDNTSDFGGGLFVGQGVTVTLTDVTVSANTADTGGGIFNFGVVELGRCLVYGNQATEDRGGGILNNGVRMDIANSTISGNTATSTTYGDGGGIAQRVATSLTLTNVTITANRAYHAGGGVWVVTTPPVLHNTIVAGNLLGAGTAPSDVWGPFDSASSYNLIGVGDGDTGLTDGVNGNLVGTAAQPLDPGLGPLTDNGGLTLTHALLPQSPAVDAGSNARAADAGLTTDQRGDGFPRFVDGNTDDTATVDIGAYETAPETLPDLAPVVGSFQVSQGNIQDLSSVDVVFNVQNVGAGALSSDFQVAFYFSTDISIQPQPGEDTELARTEITTRLVPNATTGTVQETLPLPSGLQLGRTYYIGMVIDPDRKIAESSRTNNLNQGLWTDVDDVRVGKLKWTVISYLDGDDTTFARGSTDDTLNYFEAIPNSDDVKMAYLVDFYGAGDSKRGLIAHDEDPLGFTSPGVSVWATAGDEANMGQAVTLREFGQWAVQNYPADHYVLLIADHGQGWRGLNSDSHANLDPQGQWTYSSMRYQDFADAVSSISSAIGDKIDALVFSACLMGMQEVGFGLRNSVHYMVASENSMWTTWEKWRAFYDELEADPDITPAEVGSRTVRHYIDEYPPTGNLGLTYSCYDLSQSQAVADATDLLAAALLAYLPGESQTILEHHKAGILDVRARTQHFDEADFIDLDDFAQRIKGYFGSLSNRTSAEEEVVTRADDLLAAVTAAVGTSVSTNVARGQDVVPGSHGIAIYYPFAAQSYSPGYDDLALAAAAPHWRQLIHSNLDYAGTGADILLVLDSHSTSQDAYPAALAGRSIDPYPCDLYGAPSEAVWTQYLSSVGHPRAVIWTTGESNPADSVNDDVAWALADFLNHGGRLILSGEQMPFLLWLHWESFARVYLHVDPVYDPMVAGGLKGKDDDPIGENLNDLEFGVYPAGDKLCQVTTGSVKPTSADPFLYYTGYDADGKVAGVHLEDTTSWSVPGTTYRVVYLPSFERIRGLDNRTILATRMLNWLWGTVDTTPPTAPVITRITTDTGISATDGVTRDNTLVLNGTADADSLIRLLQGGINVGTAVANGLGGWSLDCSDTPLPEGTYQFTALAMDMAGNVSPASAAFTVTVDTTPPTLTVNGLATNNATPTITGTFSDGALRVTINGKTYTMGDGNLRVSDTTWTLQIPAADALAEGAYDVSATAMDVAGNVGSDTTADELRIVLDDDSDGVSDAVEAGAPNGGDGNHDGKPDSQQANVASFRSPENGKYLTLAAPEGLDLADVHTGPNPSPKDTPQTAQFPLGFVDFAVTNAPQASATTVTLDVEPGTTLNTYYKYGPTPDDTTPHWYPFMFDGTTGAIIFADRIELQFVDGQRGDDDLQPNGKIVDVGAPGFTEHPWQNPRMRFDVNNDGRVVPLDVLLLINDINARGARGLPLVPQGAGRLPPYLDVSGDNSLAPIDVLQVINYINSRPTTSGEGEAVACMASSPELEEPPSFGVPPTALLPITAVQQPSPAPNNAHSWPATCQPLAPIRPEVGEFPSASPTVTTAVSDSALDCATRTPVADDLDGLLAELDRILPDIAEDVFCGWEQDVSKV